MTIPRMRCSLDVNEQRGVGIILATVSAEDVGAGHVLTQQRSQRAELDSRRMGAYHPKNWSDHPSNFCEPLLLARWGEGQARRVRLEQRHLARQRRAFPRAA